MLSVVLYLSLAPLSLPLALSAQLPQEDDAVVFMQLPSSNAGLSAALAASGPKISWRPFSRAELASMDLDTSEISAGAKDWIQEFTSLNGSMDEYTDLLEGNQQPAEVEGLNQTWQVVHNLLTMNFSRPKKCAGQPGPREANVSRYILDNSELRHASKGLSFRYTKQSNSRDVRTTAFWGSMVRGVDEGDGWLRVGDCYLPMVRNGKRVILKVETGGGGGERAGKSSESLLSKIRAVEARNIPGGGTRFTIVTGEGAGGGGNWTEGRTYDVDINGTLANVSGYAEALSGLGAGPSSPKFRVMNSSLAPSLYASIGSVVMASAEKQLPVGEIKQAIADAVQEGIWKAEAAAKRNNSKPTMEAVRKAVQAEVWGTWNHLAKSMLSARFKRLDHASVASQHRGGVGSFFRSVPVFDWCIILVAILLFGMQHYGLLHWPTTRALHGTTLIMWLVVASLYSVLIFKRQGTELGVLWLNGYVLELVFLVQNVLVTHIIIHAFRTPKWVNEKALFIVVIARILFQMVFYMGLAELIFSGEALAYILGFWLLYIAWQAAADDDDSSWDIMDARVIHLARAAFGERLWLAKDDSGALFVVKENKRRLSLVGLMVFCLILVDMLLHVDVALTKIEELQGNGYICFSSAAVASFCLPELVFVVRDLFRIFPGLKYGISAVLIYIAVQMLLHAVFRPPILADLVVFSGCLVISAMLPALGLLPKAGVRTVDVGTQACLPLSGADGALPTESSFTSLKSC